MNQKTRYFLIGSGLVVTIGLGTGLVASYTGQLPAFGFTRTSELGYLPADATAIAYADVQAIMNSGFRQRLREILPTSAEKDTFLEETGIDIERDIDSVTAGLMPVEDSAGGVGPLVLLRGRFDPVRIEALATQHGGTIEEYQGRRIFVAQSFPQDADAFGSQHSRNGAPAMVFLEPNLMALGQVVSLQRAIDTAGTAGASENDALMSIVSDVQGSGNAWIVGRFDRLAAGPNVPDQVRAHLPGVEWLAVSADISDSIRGYVRAETIDEDAGEQLRAVVNGAIAAARMFGGQDPKVEAALRTVQARGSGRTAEVSFAVGPELLDLMHGMRGTAGAPR
jgi:hypothetical protein